MAGRPQLKKKQNKKHFKSLGVKVTDEAEVRNMQYSEFLSVFGFFSFR